MTFHTTHSQTTTQPGVSERIARQLEDMVEASGEIASATSNCGLIKMRRDGNEFSLNLPAVILLLQCTGRLKRYPAFASQLDRRTAAFIFNAEIAKG
jgi:hypothetical protein